MANFAVNITIPDETVTELKASGYKLYGFKASKITSAAARPLVWFTTEDYLADTIVSWEEEYRAYISHTVSLNPHTQIKASASQEIDLGQTMHVDQNGVTHVRVDGQERAISILNDGTAQWACGISQLVEGKPNPLVAVPLYGSNLDVITPIEKVFFMFATAPVNTGTVIVQSFGPGLLINLTGVESRDVTYDVNKGWSPTDQTWARNIPVQSELTPLLIET